MPRARKRIAFKPYLIARRLFSVNCSLQLYKMSKLRFTALFLLGFVAASSQAEPSASPSAASSASLFERWCPGNQKFHVCKPCNWKCNQWNLPTIYCGCKPGCACARGSYWNGQLCVKPAQCIPECPSNKVYYGFCQRPCDFTCDQANQPQVCPAVCRAAGCSCPSNLPYWNGRACVSRDQCNPCPPGVVLHHCLDDPCNTATCPRHPNAECRSNYCGGCNAEFYVDNELVQDCHCESNQIYYSGCKPCQGTCENPRPKCPKICKPGCACAKGLLWNGERCIYPKACVSCKSSLNEVFRTCAPPCDATCDEPQKECSLQERCTRRCACRDGYVRNKNNVCVLPSQCPKKCPSNQIFYIGCKPCLATCDNPRPICTLDCRPGCGCGRGLLWDGKKCVYPKQCSCPSNQEYQYPCKQCQKTCSNQNRLCLTDECVTPGCGCPPDKYWNGLECVDECSDCPPGVPIVLCVKDPCDGAKCPRYPQADCRPNFCGSCKAEFFIGDRKIPEDRCAIQCPSNKIYYPRCKPCPQHCDNIDHPVACRIACTPGCECPRNTYWNGQRCVTRSQCRVCKSNQIYYSQCKPCQGTCANPNTICPAVCRPGCACRSGQLWNGNRCVSPKQCGQCPPGVPVVNCLVDPCQFAKCQNFPQARCVSNYCGGCNFDFFIGDRKIPKDQCRCKSNQIYYSGCKPCLATCDNRNPVCPAICQPGCGCASGLVWNGQKCVYPKACVSCKSSLNEVFRTCAPPCDATCDEPQKECSLQERCTRRCACREGYVRNKNNVCVLPSQCPKKCNSRLNEYYRACAAPCDATCDEPRKPCSLLKVCTPRCTCLPGYVRNSYNECVLRSKCPDCPHNQIRKCTSCVPKCPGSIAPAVTCLASLPAYPCKVQCTCPIGLFLNNVGRCVKLLQCPPLKG